MDDRVKSDSRHTLKGKLSTRMSAGNDAFDGPYIVTPNRSTQILNTSGRIMVSDVKINPIPSNYGLVTWNGSVLTIS